MIHALIFAAATAAAPRPLPKNCAPATAFTGTICAPGGSGPHPLVVVLGGSEGGNDMQYALPRFVHRGYVAASVAYFGMPGLPQSLENIPLETVGNALSALTKRSDVDSKRIAVMGVSKGGEFALLAASEYPQIRAVVAAVPSPFAWQGIAQGFGPPQSSWTFRGKPLPYVAYGSAMGQLFGEAFNTHAPIDLRTGYDESMQAHAAQIPGAMFPLQNVRGPVLCISAGDDRIWDSPAQCAIAMKYLKSHRHAFADSEQNYPSAGHLFLFSSQSRPMTSAPAGPFTLELGGTAQANLAASAAAWPKIYAFLTAALK